MEEEKKPKRQMTAEQIENLKKGREKRLQTAVQRKEITNVKKEEAKKLKLQKEKEREETYNAIIAKKEAKENPYENINSLISTKKQR